MTFIYEKLDERAIPFLLFNLAIRNISAVVLNGNVLTKEIFNGWRIEKGEVYEQIQELDDFVLGKYDIAISNPPFNIPWTPPVLDLFEKDE